MNARLSGKATNWTCAGDSKGFSQDHADYYLPNERPKKLWLKPLDPNAAALMCAPQLPENCQAALVALEITPFLL